MHLLAGLGNPGAKYAGNRHNVGFMVVDEIHRRFGFAPFRLKFDGDLSEGSIGGHKVFLLKPRTFMNDSGISVGATARFFKIPSSRVVVFHDELDLAPGKIRARTGGGVAGHNGLRSIATHFSQDFRRVRIGIGHPGDKKLVSNYVLGDFAKADRDWLEPLLRKVHPRCYHLLLPGWNDPPTVQEGGQMQRVLNVKEMQRMLDIKIMQRVVSVKEILIVSNHQTHLMNWKLHWKPMHILLALHERHHQLSHLSLHASHADDFLHRC